MANSNQSTSIWMAKTYAELNLSKEEEKVDDDDFERSIF